MFTKRTTNLLQTLAILATLFALVFSPVGSAFADSGSYPLTGELGDPSAPAYNVVWEANGRLWQPMLPEKALRREFTVSFRISEGTYVFNGSEAELRLDETRNGRGLDNPMTVGYGNDLEFTVKTRDGQPAWAIVYGRGNASGGFDIWATSPTYSGTAVSRLDQPDQPDDATAVVPPTDDTPVTPPTYVGTPVTGEDALYSLLFIALSCLGFFWALGMALYAGYAFGKRYGTGWGLLAAIAAFFMASIPCIGFPLLPLLIWACTRPPKDAVLPPVSQAPR